MQCTPYRFCHNAGFDERFVVPEPDHVESLRSQPGITIDVIGIFSVFRAIGFNDQSLLEIYKIDDVPAEYLLPFEFEARQAVASKHRP